jgi:uncharacterized protein YkwD
MKILQFVLIFFIAVFVFFYSCRKTDVISNKPNAPATTVHNESLMLQLINQQREQGCNCGSAYYPPTTAVSWNDVLESAAAAHANDMYTKNYFSHTGLDGSSPGERIMRAGYMWTAFGENIAKGFNSEQAVETAWLQSEEHCVNIMNSRFTEVGVARVGSYWVQEFGTRR